MPDYTKPETILLNNNSTLNPFNSNSTYTKPIPHNYPQLLTNKLNTSLNRNNKMMLFPNFNININQINQLQLLKEEQEEQMYAIYRKQQALIDPKYKSELCKSFISEGYCRYKNKCRFAHGIKDLKSKDEKEANENKIEDIKSKILLINNTPTHSIINADNTKTNSTLKKDSFNINDEWKTGTHSNDKNKHDNSFSTKDSLIQSTQEDVSNSNKKESNNNISQESQEENINTSSYINSPRDMSSSVKDKISETENKTVSSFNIINSVPFINYYNTQSINNNYSKTINNNYLNFLSFNAYFNKLNANNNSTTLNTNNSYVNNLTNNVFLNMNNSNNGVIYDINTQLYMKPQTNLLFNKNSTPSFYNDNKNNSYSSFLKDSEDSFYSKNIEIVRKELSTYNLSYKRLSVFTNLTEEETINSL